MAIKENLALLLCFHLVACQDLPTLYEYYTSDGIKSGLSVDQPYFTLNGKNITIYSGAFHYFRVPSGLWQDRLKKYRAAGLNAVETYVPWNLHEPRKGYYEFGSEGTDLQLFADLEGFLYLAKREDLFVIIRPGPYICAEWEWGGLPSWLLRENNITVRTSDEKFMVHVRSYFSTLLPKIAKYQFTKGGSVIAVQIENEYGSFSAPDENYLKQLVQLHKDHDIVELLFTSDGPDSGTIGTLPDLFKTVNFGSNPDYAFKALNKIQPGKPLMAMEFYPGWFDHWTEQHHVVSDTIFQTTYEEILSYPASVNLYMFHGGTNYGFLNGANDDDYQPTTTSYDYNAPISENGNYTNKYNITKTLLGKYNTIKTLVPEVPELKPCQAYDTIKIDTQLSFNDILRHAPHLVLSQSSLSMELLPINDNNGQSYGYIVYHLDSIDIPANAVLKIIGKIRDTIMVLVNGVLISKPLRSKADFNNFGYWKLNESSITLSSVSLKGASLDLVVENWGRVNFGNMLYQSKGLTDANRVLLNNVELTSWFIYPLEFTRNWNSNLKAANWVPMKTNQGPGLYKTSLHLDSYSLSNDTYIDMRGWKKGIVIVNDYVIGRYCHLGPQQTLYLPKSYIQGINNDIVIFEQFEASNEIKFVNQPIFETKP